MNRNDLEDLLDYDASAISFGGLGVALVSGAGFILIEQWFTSDTGQMNALMQVCLLLVAIGLFMGWQGKKMHDKKRSRIERIFRETREDQAPEGAKQITGSTASRTSSRASRLPKGSATGTTR